MAQVAAKTVATRTVATRTVAAGGAPRLADVGREHEVVETPRLRQQCAHVSGIDVNEHFVGEHEVAGAGAQLAEKFLERVGEGLATAAVEVLHQEGELHLVLQRGRKRERVPQHRRRGWTRHEFARL